MERLRIANEPPTFVSIIKTVNFRSVGLHGQRSDDGFLCVVV